MSSIIKDIEWIIELAKTVVREIEAGKPIKRELMRIASLDLDELRELSRNFGDKRLLDECVEVLNKCKKALRYIKHPLLSEKVKELMDEIIRIERNELLEIREDERKQDALYEYWYNNFYRMVFYHGTSNFNVEDILTNCLDPNRKPKIFRFVDELIEIILSLPPVFRNVNLPYEFSDRNGISLSLRRFYAETKNVSERVEHAIWGSDYAIKELQSIILSNGDYKRYRELRKRDLVVSQEFYKHLNIDELRRKRDMILRLSDILKRYVKRSRNVVLKVDAIDILDQLPKELANAIISFRYFKERFVLKYVESSMFFGALRKVSEYPVGEELARVLHTTFKKFFKYPNELRIYRGIDPKFIHLA